MYRRAPGTTSGETGARAFRGYRATVRRRDTLDVVRAVNCRRWSPGLLAMDPARWTCCWVPGRPRGRSPAGSRYEVGWAGGVGTLVLDAAVLLLGLVAATFRAAEGSRPFPWEGTRAGVAAGTGAAMIWVLAADTDLWADPVWLVDSTPVECALLGATTRIAQPLLALPPPSGTTAPLASPSPDP